MKITNINIFYDRSNRYLDISIERKDKIIGINIEKKLE